MVELHWWCVERTFVHCPLPRGDSRSVKSEHWWLKESSMSVTGPKNAVREVRVSSRSAAGSSDTTDILAVCCAWACWLPMVFKCSSGISWLWCEMLLARNKLTLHQQLGQMNTEITFTFVQYYFWICELVHRKNHVTWYWNKTILEQKRFGQQRVLQYGLRHAEAHFLKIVFEIVCPNRFSHKKIIFS